MYFGPLLAPLKPKLVKMAQNYFLLAPNAKLFPTRGHMPMLEQNCENWYIRSQNGLSGPKNPIFFENPKIIPFQSRLIGKN